MSKTAPNLHAIAIQTPSSLKAEIMPAPATTATVVKEGWLYKRGEHIKT